jgi:hypothetical protein
MSIIRPIINEISPATSMLIRNKYIDIYRRAYFINKIYESGIKNIEIGSFRKYDNVLFGTRDVLFNVNRRVDASRSALVMEIENTLKNVACKQSVHPSVDQLVYEIKDEKNVEEFLKHKIVAKQLGMKTKLILPVDKLNLYKETDPDFVEVTDLSNEILSIADPSKIFLRTNKFNDVDIALYNGVFNFSSSLLKTDEFLNTIELITYLRGKLGVEVNVNLEKLKETQKEMMDEFNW